MRSHQLPILLALVAGMAFGQDPPFRSTPTIGWDSLQTLLRVPEIVLRSGFPGSVTVTFSVDSLGDAHIANLKSTSDLFHAAVTACILGTKWTLRPFGPNTYSEFQTVEFLFRTKDPNVSKTLIIETVPRIRK